MALQLKMGVCGWTYAWQARGETARAIAYINISRFFCIGVAAFAHIEADRRAGQVKGVAQAV